MNWWKLTNSIANKFKLVFNPIILICFHPMEIFFPWIFTNICPIKNIKNWIILNNIFQVNGKIICINSLILWSDNKVNKFFYQYPINFCKFEKFTNCISSSLLEPKTSFNLSVINSISFLNCSLYFHCFKSVFPVSFFIQYFLIFKW